MTAPQPDAENPRSGNGAWDVVVVGAGLAGLSAAVYLGRAQRRTLVVDNGRSLALWEPKVENYLGFPEGIAGAELLSRGRRQAEQYGVAFREETVLHARRSDELFQLKGEAEDYSARRVLLATGLYHLPPEVPGVDECVGKSMFFCKDCDAVRVQGRRIAIIGRNNDAVEYALAMVAYSPCVVIATNGAPPRWDQAHAQWISEYEVPVYPERITELEHSDGQLRSITFENRLRVAVDALFTTRGDVYHNAIATDLGAAADPEGQILVDDALRTTVPGLYAAGCVTLANCQMIIAAGQGAIAAQSINRDLFEESLRTHSLRRFRERQLDAEKTAPDILEYVS